MVTKQKLTLEEFLELPSEDPSFEFVDGEVVAKPVPQTQHSILQRELILQLAKAGASEAFQVLPESRYLFGAPRRVYVPDVSVVDQGRMPLDQRGRFADRLEMAPDIAIEVLSPDQSAGHLLDKLRFYIDNGVRLALIVDPERDLVTIYSPGLAPTSVSPPDAVDLSEVIPRFRLDLASLFAALHPATN